MNTTHRAHAELVKCFKQAEGRKQNFVTLYRKVQELVNPHKENFTERSEGTDRSNAIHLIFDSLPQRAADKFVSFIQTSLVPPGKKWAELVVGEDIDDTEVERIAPVIEDINNKMFSRLHTSNFDTQIAECFHDLLLGSSALLVQRGPSIERPFEFAAVPIEQIYWNEGANGSVNEVFRKHKVLGANVLVTWPKMAERASPEFLQRLKDEPYKYITFIEATYPAKINVTQVEVFKNQLGTEVMETVTKQVDGFVYSVWAENTNGSTMNQVLVEEELRSNPWITFRWVVTAGEVWGRGQAVVAYADIKTLHEIKNLYLKNAQLAIGSAFTCVNDGVVDMDNIDFTPNAINPVASNGGNLQGPTLMPITSGSRFDLAQLSIKELHASINDTFYAEPLGSVDAPVKTATELTLRQQEMAMRIASAFGRLKSELMIPLVDRLLYLMSEWGIIAEKDLKVDGGAMKLEYISPLARAQEREELNAITEYIQTVAGLYGPEIAMAMAPPDKICRRMAELLNVPPSVLPSEEEITALKQKLGQRFDRMEQGEQNAVDRGESISG